MTDEELRQLRHQVGCAMFLVGLLLPIVLFMFATMIKANFFKVWE